MRRKERSKLREITSVKDINLEKRSRVSARFPITVQVFVIVNFWLFQKWYTNHGCLTMLITIKSAFLDCELSSEMIRHVTSCIKFSKLSFLCHIRIPRSQHILFILTHVCNSLGFDFLPI